MSTVPRAQRLAMITPKRTAAGASVTVERADDGVAVLLLANPPVNSFTAALGHQLVATLAQCVRDDGIKAEASDVFSHIKIELPTSQLAAANAVLADLQLI